MKPIGNPYIFSPLFEEALIWSCATDADFWQKFGQHVEIENLSDNGQVNEKFSPSKMAMRAVASIAARTGRGPVSTTEVMQELHMWLHDGKLTQEAVGAVEVMLTRAAQDPKRPSRSAIIDQLVQAITSNLLMQASIACGSAFSAREASCPEARRILDIIDSFKNGATPTAVSVDVEVLDDVQLEKIHWLWKGRIPFGKLTVLDGDPKLGKSLCTIEIAARASRGEPLRGDEGRQLAPINVLIVSGEDGLSDTVAPRLRAANADMQRVRTLRIKDHGVERFPELSQGDLALIRDTIKRHQIKLLIFDPLMCFVPDRIDVNTDHKMRRILAPLASLAEELGCAVVVVRHLNKDSKSGKAAIHRGGGSIGISGAARSVLIIARDPDDPRHRRVLAVAGITSAPTAPSLAFEIISDYADDGKGEQIETCRLVWCGESPHTADELVAAPPEKKKTAVEVAMDFLQEELADGQPRIEREVAARAKARDINERALQRARSELKVKSRKRVGDGLSEIWIEKAVEPTETTGAPGVGGGGGVPPSVQQHHHHHQGEAGSNGLDASPGSAATRPPPPPPAPTEAP